MPAINSEYDIENAEWLALLTAEQAWHFRCVPKLVEEESIIVWSQESTSAKQLSVLLGKEIETVVIPEPVLEGLLQRYYRLDQGRGKAEFSRSEHDSHLASIIADAHEQGSSDIHFERYSGGARVRIRVDGELMERHVIALDEYPALINQIKIQANLDIAERRLPQDGRMQVETGSAVFDVRVSVLPAMRGEKVVMRLLGKDASHLKLDAIGFETEELHRYREGLRRPNGIMLISGPTGSGKTTTLYASLQELNETRRNILTIEDPIEYTLEGINQVQLRESIGLTFGAAMRSFLRQDPDVIMVGEIRDPDTANMAIRASLTGHLVLSTIHTNSAWDTVARLMDMGVPPYLIAGTLNTSVAQRLVRLLCEHCKQPAVVPDGAMPGNWESKGLQEMAVAVGCRRCHQTGYRGRQALFEVIGMNAVLSEAIRAGKLEVGPELTKMGIASLSARAYDLFASKMTSLEEVYPLLIS